MTRLLPIHTCNACSHLDENSEECALEGLETRSYNLRGKLMPIPIPDWCPLEEVKDETD